MVEEIKRLFLQLSKSEVARALNLSRSTLYEILKRNDLQQEVQVRKLHCNC